MSRALLQPWNILSTRVIHRTPWIEIVEDTCLADGKQLVYTYTRRVDQGPVIVAEEQDGRLWMVQQYRHPIKKIVWQFPQEGRLNNESWEQAAQRGLTEELRLQADKLHEIGQFYPDPGGLDQTYRFFIATNLKQHTAHVEHAVDEVEELRIRAFSRKEIDELIAKGELCDNWTLAALFLYDRYKRTNA